MSAAKRKGSTKRRKKRKNARVNVALRAIVALMVVLAMGVVVWQVRERFTGSATTAIVRSETPGNYYRGTVVIARNETLYETENKTSIDFVAQEGSRVSRSGVICKVYSSGYNKTEINRLNTQRKNIQNYHVSQVFNTYVDAALDSDNSEIDQLAQQVRSLVQQRGVGSLSNLERQLASALTARKNYLKQKYPDDQTLAELYKVENDQLKKIESWTTTYTATEDCIVSFYTDGYENTVNGNTYAALTPADVRNVIRGAAPEQSTISRGSDPIFRTVSPDTWYILFLCQDKEWNPVVGETYQLQLEGFDNYIVEGKVESFSRIGNDLLLRMSTHSAIEQVLNIRTCGATVGDFMTGLRVPVDALYAQDDMIGVVVVDGGMQTFVEVVVISYLDAHTAFVRPRLEGSPLVEGKTVLLF